MPAQDTNSDFQHAFKIAQEALGYVGKFLTPPTPEVYAVWYRFVEGANESLNERLKYAIEEARAADSNLLLQLYREFLSSNESGEQIHQINDELIANMVSVAGIVDAQLSAGASFHDTLGTAAESLRRQSLTANQVKSCVAALMASNSAMQAEVSKSREALAATQLQVAELRNQLIETSMALMTDPLTGVGNRRFFDSMLKQAISQRNDTTTHRCLILVDLDNLKLINDTHGHVSGDAVIRYMAKKLQEEANEGSVARLGGDEFAIFWNTSDEESVKPFVEAIASRISTSNVRLDRDDKPLLGKLTCSIGVSILRENDTQAGWFERADKLLYQAKAAGKNAVRCERLMVRRQGGDE